MEIFRHSNASLDEGRDASLVQALLGQETQDILMEFWRKQLLPTGQSDMAVAAQQYMKRRFE